MVNNHLQALPEVDLFRVRDKCHMNSNVWLNARGCRGWLPNHMRARHRTTFQARTVGIAVSRTVRHKHSFIPRGAQLNLI